MTLKAAKEWKPFTKEDFRSRRALEEKRLKKDVGISELGRAKGIDLDKYDTRLTKTLDDEIKKWPKDQQDSLRELRKNMLSVLAYPEELSALAERRALAGTEVVRPKEVSSEGIISRVGKTETSQARLAKLQNMHDELGKQHIGADLFKRKLSYLNLQSEFFDKVGGDMREGKDAYEASILATAKDLKAMSEYVLGKPVTDVKAAAQEVIDKYETTAGRLEAERIANDLQLDGAGGLYRGPGSSEGEALMEREARAAKKETGATTLKPGPGDEFKLGGMGIMRGNFAGMDDGMAAKAGTALASWVRPLQKAILQFSRGKRGAITEAERLATARDVVELNLDRMDPMRHKEVLSDDPATIQRVDNVTFATYLAGGDMKWVSNADIARFAKQIMVVDSSQRKQTRELFQVAQPIFKGIQAAADAHNVSFKTADRKLGEYLSSKDPNRGMSTGWAELDSIIPEWRKFMKEVGNSQGAKDLLKGLYIRDYYPQIPDMQAAWDHFRKGFSEAKDPRDIHSGWDSLPDKQQQDLLYLMKEKPSWDNLDPTEKAMVNRNLMHWHNIFDTRESMPGDMYEHFSGDYNRHLQMRKGHKEFFIPKSAASEVLKDYVFRMVRSNSRNDIMPLAKELMGKYRYTDDIRSVRHILGEMTKQSLHMKSKDDIFAQGVMNSFNKYYKELPGFIRNQTFGENLPTDPNKIVGRGLIGGMARGALGYVTAIRKMIQLGNTWAEYGTGPFLKNMATVVKTGGLKFWDTRAPLKSIEGIRGAVESWDMWSLHHGIVEEFTGREKGLTGLKERMASAEGTGKKMYELYETIGNWALNPITWSTNFKNAITFLSALEDAGKRGYSRDVAFRYGLKKLHSAEHDVFIPEDVAKATADTERLMLGFHPVHSSPITRGPLGKAATIFLRYPRGQALDLGQGVWRNLLMGDNAKFFRWTMLLGAHLTMASTFAAVGLDAKGVFDALGAFKPFGAAVDMVGGAYNASYGYLSGDAEQEERGLTSLSRSVGTMFVPQYTNIQRIHKTVDAMADGVWRDKRTQLPIADTTWFNAGASLMGYDPKANKQVHEIVQEYATERKSDIVKKRYYQDRAVEAITRGDREGAIKIIQDANSKGIKINRKSVLDAVNARKESDYLKEMIRRAPKEKRKALEERRQAILQEYMPSKAKPKPARSFWSNENRQENLGEESMEGGQ